MATENTNAEVKVLQQQQPQLPDEAETAATLLKIMAGHADAMITTAAGSPLTKSQENDSKVSPIGFQPWIHQLTSGLETNQHSFQVQASQSPVPPQVPNPLQNTLSNLMTAASSNSTRGSNDSAFGSSTSHKNNEQPASVFVAEPPQNHNNSFVVPSPSTYALLQSMIHQQQASLAAAASSRNTNTDMMMRMMCNLRPVDTTTTTPDPLQLLLAKNQIVQPSSVNISTSTSTPSRSSVSAKEAELIRREEVEKALNSKPQRGRKRRNLNEEERQELTRTRNREHAKSTRERKKQRHTELLDRERLYQALKQQQELQGRRREIVCQFVEARQSMLQQILDGNNPSSEDSPTAAIADKIDNLILSRSDFRYHIRGQRGGAEIDGATLMGLFDRSFAALLPAQGAEASYRYDEDCIALTERGDAMLECSICFESRVVKTLQMTISFADETAKILAVDIAFLQEESSSERQPSLGNQVSHPSVVSLDERFGPVALQDRR